MKNEACPALSSWRVLIDFASYLVAEVQQPTCHLWTNIKWVFTFKIRYVLLSYKSKVIQLNCKQWNEMAYLILNSPLNLNLFLDLSSCHRSMGCLVLNIDFGPSTADIGSIWSPDLSAQTRPSIQCKSRIDVLILRKYLEKENIFFFV